jgi:hypothetical protein
MTGIILQKQAYKLRQCNIIKIYPEWHPEMRNSFSMHRKEPKPFGSLQERA